MSSKDVFLSSVETCCGHFESIEAYRPVASTGSSWVRCSACDWRLDVYAHVSDESRPDRTTLCKLAEAYARWTGDVGVPMPLMLPYEKLESIRPVTATAPLRVVSNAVQLFRLVNSPFVGSQTVGPKPKIFEHFLSEYLGSLSGVLDRGANDDDSDETKGLYVLTQVLEGMQKFASMDVDVFDYYASKLVPYVIECARENGVVATEETVAVDADACLGEQFYFHASNSCAIRKTFSRFSMGFEVVHVMITCYALSSSYELVANVAFDAVARVCRGDFFNRDEKNRSRVRAVLDADCSRTSNVELYYALREIRQGRSEESLSTIVFKYAQIERLLEKHLVDEVVRSQVFPAAVFEDSGDYLGFVLALSHVSSSVDSKGRLPKKSFATARKLHRVVRKFAEAIKEFEKGSRETVFWTVETFKMFLATYADLEAYVEEMASLITAASPEFRDGREEEEDMET